MDRPTIFKDEEWELGEWTVSPISARGDEPAPHREFWSGPIPLGIIWADKEQTIPLAARDIDGCEALITKRLK